jgi:oligopeptide/dipeptide ABC transporter ATP-binding protein
LLKAVPSLVDDDARKLETIEGTPPFLLHVPPGCPFAERCDYAMHICKEQEPVYFHPMENNRAYCWLYDPRGEEQLKRFQADQSDT